MPTPRSNFSQPQLSSQELLAGVGRIRAISSLGSRVYSIASLSVKSCLLACTHFSWHGESLQNRGSSDLPLSPRSAFLRISKRCRHRRKTKSRHSQLPRLSARSPPARPLGRREALSVPHMKLHGQQGLGDVGLVRAAECQGEVTQPWPFCSTFIWPKLRGVPASRLTAALPPQ